MKKTLPKLLGTVCLLFSACNVSEIDVTDIRNEIDDLKSRITLLETQVKAINSDITALQAVVNAAQSSIYITKFTETDGSCIISFSDGTSYTIKNGKDGQDGKDGNNGADGQDGKDGKDGQNAPVIGVALYEGVYYWTITIDGTTTWLTDSNNNKLRVTGEKGADGNDGQDGQDGQDGKDGNDGADGADGQNGRDGQDGQNGVTPLVTIDDEGYWCISYDAGATSTRILDSEGNPISALGVKGDKGEQGEQGEKGEQGEQGYAEPFRDVTQDDDNVYFLLKDGTTVITIPKRYTAFTLTFTPADGISCEAGETVELSYLLSYGSAKTAIGVVPNNGWVAELTKTDEKSGKIALTAPTPNTNAEIVVYASDGEGQSVIKVIVATMASANSTLTVADNGYSVDPTASQIEIDVQTNMEYTVSIPHEAVSWISLASVTTRAVMRDDVVRLDIAANPEPQSRTATVRLVDADDNTLESVVIYQGPKVYADNIIRYEAPAQVEPAAGAFLDEYGNKLTYTNNFSEGKGKLVFNKDVYIVGGNAFRNCSSLTAIHLPNTVKTIGESAFYACAALKTITLSDDLISIEKEAFNACRALESIVIPNSVTTIGANAFMGCFALKYVTMSDNIKSLDGTAFNGGNNRPTSLTKFFGAKVSADNRCVVIDGKLCAFAGALLENTEYTVPSNVTEIGPYVFNYQLDLTRVTMSVGVTAIRNNAFEYCTALKTVELPANLLIIGSYAFRNCGNLTGITIPNSVTSIGGAAFQDCGSLTNVSIPESVTVINDSAFSSCSSLANVSIMGNVTSIGRWAFDGCSRLTNITIPNSVISIGSRAFGGCTSLMSINIPDSVTSIDGSAFSVCTSLASVSIGSSVASIGNDAFGGCTSLASITIPDSVTSIGSYAFSGCTGLTAVYITDIANWCKIGFNQWSSNPLYYAHNLYLNGELVTNLVIPDGVTSIGFRTFNNCTSLTNITIPDSVTSIDESAFEGCSNLTSIVIPQNITSINKGTFTGCTSLASVTLPHGLASIGGSAFKNSGIESITIPESVSSISDSAFSGCNSLSEIKGKFATDDHKFMIVEDFANKTKTLKAFAAAGATSCNVPEGVTHIGGEVVNNSTDLTSVNISSTVVAIGRNAFSQNSKLFNVYCQAETPPAISISSTNPFADCMSACQFHVPTASVNAYKEAAGWSYYKWQIEGFDF